MFLAVSIDNACVNFGIFEDTKLIQSFKLSTDLSKTSDEYAYILHGLLEINGINPTQLSDCMISSVVAPLSSVLSDAIERIINTKPNFVGPGIKTGLNIKIDNPAQLGSDIVALTVGATCKYKAPLIIIDLGIVTTMSVVSESGVFNGTLIIPGIRSSLDSMSNVAGSLPAISIEQPRTLVGKNTVDSMRSGILNGTSAMIDGLINKIIQDQKFETAPTVVATGVFAELIVPYCTHKLLHDSTLLMDGLCHLHHKNMHCTLKKGQ